MNVSDRPVLVLPRGKRTLGLDHDPALPHEGRRADGSAYAYDPEVWPLVTLEAALRRRWEGDAHCAMYAIPGEEGSPRINQGAWPWLQAQGKEPVMLRVLVDVDFPDHTTWDDYPGAEADWARTLGVLAAVPDLAGAAWYHTRAGYRLWWELETPVPVSRWWGWISRFNAYLLDLGIPLDPKVSDATRLMRLPLVQRDGEPEDRPRSDHLPGFLRWQPSGALQARMPAPAALRVPSASAPAYTPPTEGEWAMLERRSSAALVRTLRDGRPLAKPPAERPPGAPGRDSLALQAMGTIIRGFGVLDPALLYRYMYESIRAQDPPAEICEATLWDRAVYLTQKHGQQAGHPAPAEAPAPTAPPALTLVAGGAPAQGVAELPPDGDEEGGALEETPAEDDLLTRMVADTSEYASLGAAARRLLLTEPTAKAFWVRDQHASRPGMEVYQGPFASSLVVTGLERYSPSLCGAVRTQGGNPHGTPRLMADMGQVVDNVIIRAGAQHTIYYPSMDTLVCRAAPWREDIRPREHTDIARWLELVGADRLDELLDWLATFRQLNQATCGLYIRGPKGIGKQLLAMGLARLFVSGEVVPYETLTGEFPEELLRSMLVWADETIPRNHKGQTPSALFRSLVANETRRVNRKGIPALTLWGFARLLITANNDDVFAVEQEDLGTDDVAAIIERIGYIRTGDEAARYLDRLGGKPYTDRWVAGDALAEHVRWLEETRTVKTGSRYLVTGWRTEMHDHLLQRAGLTQLVLTLLALILDDYAQQNRDQALRVGEGRIWVNGNKLRKLWPALLPDARPPTLHRLTATLRTLARPFNDDGELTRSHRVGATSLQYWHIDAPSVLRTAEALQIGDVEAMRRRIENNS